MGEITRCDGTTTKQMTEAPRDAIFVWCNGHLDYPRRLAQHLGRKDLRIEGPTFFENRWRGLRRPVVVDHAAARMMTRQQREGWNECMDYLSHIQLPN